MNKEEARAFLENRLEEHKRWGKIGAGMDLSLQEQLLEAIEGLVGDDTPMVPREELTKANRQLTAAKAREARLRKQLEGKETEE